PDLLAQWWPRVAQVTPGVGGGYAFSWPDLGQTLRGSYTAFAPGRALALTWQGDHEARREPPLTVPPALAPLARAQRTALRPARGQYADSPGERETRAGHLQGWLYFLAKLQRLAPARDWTRGVPGDEGERDAN